MEEKKVIRAAIIGSGQIARTSHIPAYRSMENVEIVLPAKEWFRYI